MNQQLDKGKEFITLIFDANLVYLFELTVRTASI